MRALAVATEQRNPTLPDLPPIADTLPGFDGSSINYISAPAGTPQPIVERLNHAVNEILLRPDVKGAWEKQGAEPMAMTPEQFGAHVGSEIDKWAKIITANAIKGE